MFGTFHCAFLSGLLIRVADFAPSPGIVVYPRLLEARGLDAEKVLYIQDDIVLRLQKTAILSENIVFRENLDGTRVDKIMNGKELEANIYHDRNRMASVKVEERNGSVKVKGILSDTLRIAPLDISARSDDSQIPHEIFQVEQRAGIRGNYKVGPEMKSSETFFAELKIVADGYHQSAFETPQGLVQYFALCMKLVNIRYEDTSNPRVQFLLTTVEVAEKDFPELFTAPDVDCPGRSMKTYMDPLLMLNKTANVYGKSDEDVTVFVTSLDLADNFDGTAYNRVMGQTRLGGLCKDGRRVAIVEDVPPTYSMIQIIAHELAHTLGAAHDGEKPLWSIADKLKSRCHYSSGHLMAPSTHGENNGHFSNCSIEQIEAFVGTLPQSCLDVKLETYHKVIASELPGMNLNRTYYCQKKHPNYPRIVPDNDGYFMPRCKVMCCADGTEPCFEELAVDGMFCQKNKVCFRHRCVDPPNLLATSP
ncbi:venom metalloproteinase antarease-like TtrivMP_A [Ixodes scapularis]|uniref:venom metalloproteinase antarease-like TtrivMP_A n=1 Tax=Ixodes scapularis TaxID=6945 RepID=UPI001A9FD373|nr:venom metalloproteinase antarease-like TtrivMP_A [Ixodes scapularis]